MKARKERAVELFLHVEAKTRASNRERLGSALHGSTWRARLAGVLAASALGLGAAPVCGGVVYQTGFEKPTFEPGALDGQGGWSVFEGSSGILASISATFPHNGLQAMQIDPVANAAGGVVAKGFRYLPGGAGPVYDGSGQVVSIKADFALFGPGTGATDAISVNFQPWLYSTDFAIEFPRSQMWLSSDGQLHFEHDLTQVTGPAFELGQYNELEARLDFVKQQSLYFLNGAPVGDDSWADLGVVITAYSSPEFLLTESHASGSYNPLDYKAFVDDVRISVVPAPSSIALLAIGVLGVVLQRRFRHPSNAATRITDERAGRRDTAETFEWRLGLALAPLAMPKAVIAQRRVVALAPTNARCGHTC